MKLFLLFLSFTLALVWKDNTIIYIFQALVKVGLRFQTAGFVIKDYDAKDPVTSFSSILN